MKVDRNVYLKMKTLEAAREILFNSFPPAEILSPEILPGVLETMAFCTQLFGRIIVVTNQQGIGKGLMTEEDLLMIHDHLLNEVDKAQGKIDKIYHCPHLESDDCICRKPKNCMAIAAQKDFPEIDFKKSIMVGDSEGDMEFGWRLSMRCIGIHVKGDYKVDSLSGILAYLAVDDSDTDC